MVEFEVCKIHRDGCDLSEFCAEPDIVTAGLRSHFDKVAFCVVMVGSRHFKTLVDTGIRSLHLRVTDGTFVVPVIVFGRFDELFDDDLGSLNFEEQRVDEDSIEVGKYFDELFNDHSALDFEEQRVVKVFVEIGKYFDELVEDDRGAFVEVGKYFDEQVDDDRGALDFEEQRVVEVFVEIGRHFEELVEDDRGALDFEEQRGVELVEPVLKRSQVVAESEPLL